MGKEMTRQEFVDLIESRGYRLASDSASSVPGLDSEIFSRGFGDYDVQIVLYVQNRGPPGKKWYMAAFWNPPGRDRYEILDSVEFQIGESNDFELTDLVAAHRNLVSRLETIAKSAQVPKNLERFVKTVSGKR